MPALLRRSFVLQPSRYVLRSNVAAPRLLRFSFLKSAVIEPSIPTIANFQPAPGVTRLPTDHVSFDVLDTKGFRRIYIVNINPDGTREDIFDGSGTPGATGPPVVPSTFTGTFLGAYASFSLRTVVLGGHHFDVARAGGWLYTPQLKIIANNFDGREA
jgi:hypothetical protein